MLRTGTPSVVARLEHGRCVLDLRCIADDDDTRLADAVVAVARRLDARVDPGPA
jgi:L-seryl-tRNA(Ser) seleniumtransferase